MITMRLKGGMGNQMFQYAFGHQLAHQLQTELKIDLSVLLDRSRADIVPREYDLSIFKLEADFVQSSGFLHNIHRFRSSAISKFNRKWVERGKTIIKEKHFHVDESLLQQPIDEAIYDGWWQSHRYFENVETSLRKAFTFRHAVVPQSKALLQQIQRTHAICLNVRRTDFLKVDNLNTTNKAYFLKAAELVASKVSDPHFYIFSDDIAWCEAELKLPYPTTLVRHDVKGKKFSNYLRLMKSCRHFIIPNSSFAWWAVWLNGQSDKIVVAPRNWFNDPQFDTSDLVPKEWLRL